MSDASPSPEKTAAEPAADLIPILRAPDPRLKAKARRITPEHMEEVRRLVPRMLAAMYAAPGIGLAAPQVGVGLRLAVVDLQPEEVKTPIVLINPTIDQVSESLAAREEGCLSIPGQYADVTRPERVVVSYQDLDGRKQTIEADGLLATCLQHEIDHLDGVLFVDHLSSLKRNMIMRKLAKEQRLRRPE